MSSFGSKDEVNHEEIDRIRSVYSGRDNNKKNLYDWYRKDVLLNNYRFRSVVSDVLVKHNWSDLSDKTILDVGCGYGEWLRTLLEWGCVPQNLFGIDILENRIIEANKRSPNISFSVTNGDALEFERESMDMVCANTVFSSILDSESRIFLASEMLRVVRPGGLIFIYDFRVNNPANPDVVGITKNEVDRLFPNLHFERRSITLAPPLQRMFVKVSPVIAHLTESMFPFLRTHICHFGWNK